MASQQSLGLPDPWELEACWVLLGPGSDEPDLISLTAPESNHLEDRVLLNGPERPALPATSQPGPSEQVPCAQWLTALAGPKTNKPQAMGPETPQEHEEAPEAPAASSTTAPAAPQSAPPLQRFDRADSPVTSAYGNRARLRLRPPKRRKADSSGEASAPAAGSLDMDVQEALLRRQHHLASLSELKVAAAVDRLQQPVGHATVGQSSHLEALQKLHDLTKLPGSGTATRPADPRPLSLEGVFVHPGWNAVVPCQYSITTVFRALELGNLDLPIQFSPEGWGKRATLRELTNIEDWHFDAILKSSMNRCVNAMTFMKDIDTRDACYRTLLSNAGLMSLLGSICYKDKHMGRLGLTGEQLLRSSAEGDQVQINQSLKGHMKLDTSQTRLASKLWNHTCHLVQQLELERLELVSSFNPFDTQPLAWQAPLEAHWPRQSRAMEQSVKLAENEQRQLEVVRNASLIWVWQVCSPDNGARLICRSSPNPPDVISALRTVATGC
ncbi:hypothetical protein WJX74_002923 [Apatococcus lobatus]|uniref:Uncharacterized protein n=1 Tax=Apatococcus lobatus TaxID=904363 RepID=A0AAW1RRY9_9CHLO